jgi:hypothetical protein
MRSPDVLVFVPCTIVSEANSREHWAAKAKRVKGQRLAAKFQTQSAIRRLLCRGDDEKDVAEREVLVQLHVTRSRRLDDDNLVGGLKAIRDGVADALGRNDGANSGLKFAAPTQSTSSDKRQHGVLVSIWIESGPAVAP